MKTSILAALVSLFLAPGALPAAEVVLVEAESLAAKGGWQVDQQFMDQMGSPYLLAHGLGEPVPDAVGEVSFPLAGEYRVWVRTRDWVAPWKVPGAPGRFQVLVNDRALGPTFGVEGEPWHWQDGGVVTVAAAAKLALHDLTGFEGRCDAILFCRDLKYHPPDGGQELAHLRGELLGWNLAPADGGRFDLVVVGGGVAGSASAVAAARQGLKVALIQDRPVLGGNGSSEVRVWPEGNINLEPYPRVGDIIGELIPPRPAGVAGTIEGKAYDDELKERIVRAEKNITLLLNHRAMSPEVWDHRIVSVVVQHTESGQRQRISGKFFADCTGDGVIGGLAGADFDLMDSGNMGMTNPWTVGAVERSEPQLRCLCKDLDPWSFAFKEARTEQPFPRCPWAIDMSEISFPGRKSSTAQKSGADPQSRLGRWFWESGFDKHPIDDMEWVRDYNFRAMYGAWDTLKNVDKLYPNERLKWAAFIAGKRESRRLMGDVIVTADDFRKKTEWPDPAFPCTWRIDIHDPDPKFKATGVEPFISRATKGEGYDYLGPYWAPYRCLYSRNINNLFMAGRDISVSHDGLGAVRVMRTCGMMGEAVGKAAWIAVRYDTTPRGVYEHHLALFKELLSAKGAARRDDLAGPLQAPADVASDRGQPIVDVASREGIMIDDSAARLKGQWRSQGKLAGFVGTGYHYSSDEKATAVYPIVVKATRTYEVRASWQPHANRGKTVAITVNSAEGSKQITVDQTKPASGENGFQSLGEFRFEANRPGEVIYSVAGSQGIVHVDAILVAPKGDAAR